MSEQPVPEHSVVIIGAGLAGLYAAKLLQPDFPDLIVLEATDRPGGRVRQVHDIAPWPVESGPQFIHGAHSSLQELLLEMDCNVHEHAWPDRWYFGRDRRFIDASIKDADLKSTHNLFADVGQESYPETDISAEEWLRSKGANEQMLAIADACYANDFGCSLQQLGLREMITENRKWDSGDSYLVLDRDLSCLIKHIAKDLHRSILFNCPVTRITHSEEGASITAPGIGQVKAKHVLLTVPVTVLQREDIQFTPPLPEAKLKAIQRVKMSNAVKVIMLFEQPFWPHDFFDVICTDSFIPEFWVTKPSAQQALHLATPRAAHQAQHTPAPQTRTEAQAQVTVDSSTQTQSSAVDNPSSSTSDQLSSAPQPQVCTEQQPAQGGGSQQQPPAKFGSLQRSVGLAQASAGTPAKAHMHQQQGGRLQLELQQDQAEHSQQEAGTGEQQNLPDSGPQPSQPQHQQPQQHSDFPRQQPQQHSECPQQHPQQQSVCLQQQQPQQHSEYPQQQPQQQSGQFAQQQNEQQQNQLPEPDVHCMVGFVAGSKAEDISKMSQTAVIMNTLAQLDTMFGSSSQKHPATYNFIRAHVVDWSREKHMYGAYTYPSLHAEVGDRDVLAEPLNDTVFFAGEATHPAINPCMQAAMETGQRAAEQILGQCKKSGSKL